MENKKRSIGIAMSGGGARGIAHLGVLEALHQHGIEPQVVAGTSMGAIVGCFYAAGYEPRFILEEIKKEKIRKFLTWSLPDEGFLDLEYMEELMSQHIPSDDFSALKKPLFVSVSNLNTGEYEVINKGPLFKYVIASASIPVIFKPQVINDHTYVDGGLLHNLPSRDLVGLCDTIIGVNVNLSAPVNKISGMKHIVERCLRLGIESNMKEDLEVCDVVISPLKVRAYNTYDFRKADEIFKVGFDEAIEVLQNNMDIFTT